MELAILLLRKALGLNQQEMAGRLGCGYSTLQGYEGGRRLSPEVRDAAIDLARQHHLESLAHLLSGESADPKPAPRYNAANRRWHDMLETILESGDPQALDAVKPNLTLFYAWVQKVKNKKSGGI